MAMSSQMSSATAEEFELVRSEGFGGGSSEGKFEGWSYWAQSKEAHIELRTMGAFLEPHELIRQLMSTFAEWEIEGDVTWLSRTMRDWCLRLVRSLKRTYHELEWQKASELAKVCVWESVRRTYREDEDQGFLTRKVRLGLDLVATQEVEWSWSEQ